MSKPVNHYFGVREAICDHAFVVIARAGSQQKPRLTEELRIAEDWAYRLWQALERERTEKPIAWALSRGARNQSTKAVIEWLAQQEPDPSARKRIRKTAGLEKRVDKMRERLVAEERAFLKVAGLAEGKSQDAWAMLRAVSVRLEETRSAVTISKPYSRHRPETWLQIRRSPGIGLRKVKVRRAGYIIGERWTLAIGLPTELQLEFVWDVLENLLLLPYGPILSIPLHSQVRRAA